MASDDPDDENERAQRSRIPKHPGRMSTTPSPPRSQNPTNQAESPSSRACADNFASRHTLSKMGAPPVPAP